MFNISETNLPMASKLLYRPPTYEIAMQVLAGAPIQNKKRVKTVNHISPGVNKTKKISTVGF